MVVGEACRKIAQALHVASVSSPLFEARQLAGGILGLSQAQVIEGGTPLTEDQERALFQAAERRKQGYPLQYLVGQWEFFGLPFFVGEGVLIPRQDTETLCETALEWLQGKTGQRVIDLCSGSGCIAVAVDRFAPGNRVYALEKSPEAADYLSRNLALNQSRTELVLADVLDPPEDLTGFDLVLSNPPYLNQEEMDTLQREVTFEPSMALYAQRDGYFFYEEITRLWKKRLNPGAHLAYEVGWRQSQKVAQILKEQGFGEIAVREDLCGVPRVVSGRWPG